MGDSAYCDYVILNAQWLKYFEMDRRTCMFHAIIYRENALINTARFPSRSCYNHETGMLCYTDNNVAHLEADGIYTMEPHDAVAECPTHRLAMDDVVYLTQNLDARGAAKGHRERRSFDKNKDAERGRKPFIGKASSQDELSEDRSPIKKSFMDLLTSRKTIKSHSEDKLDLSSPNLQSPTKTKQKKPSFSSLDSNENTSTVAQEPSLFDHESSDEEELQDTLKDLALKDKKRDVNNSRRSTTMSEGKKKRTSQHTLNSFGLEDCFHSGMMQMRLSLTGFEQFFVSIENRNMMLYKTVEEFQQEKPAFKEYDLQGVVAYPSYTSDSTYTFDLEFSDFTLPCETETFDSMMQWVSTINTSALAVTPDHGTHDLFDKDMHFLIFHSELNLLMQSFKDSVVMVQPCSQVSKADIVQSPPRGIARERDMHKDKPYKLVVYDTETYVAPPLVKGITINGIVENLTSVWSLNYALATTIVYCHRHFTTSLQLLNLLTERLHIDAEPDHPLFAWKPVVKLRTAWAPDFMDTDTMTALDKFINCIPSSFGTTKQDKVFNTKYGPHFLNISGYLREIVKKCELAVSPAASVPSETAKPKIESTILNLDPYDVANALLEKEYKMMMAIKPVQFLVRQWQDESNPIIGKAISAINEMIAQFNNVSFWVATEICTQPELKSRVKAIEKFIKIATICRKINHFSALLAIISGLNLVSVSRLKATWELVEQKRMKQLHDLENFLSPQGNYKLYRAAIEELGHTAFRIPILSLFVKDLLFSNDGNPKYLEIEGEQMPDKTLRLINVEKLVSIHRKVAQFCQFRKSSVTIPETKEEAREFVENMRVLKEQVLYKYSCLCEPKVGDTESLRGKWMNG